MSSDLLPSDRVEESLSISQFLELLKITPDMEIDVETDGKNLVLKPIRTASKQQVKDSLERVVQRHRKSLRKLAE
jgi:hypothetical protein